MNRNNITRHLLVLGFGLLLSACGGGEEGGDSSKVSVTTSSSAGTNSAPSLSGSPTATVLQGVTYSFAPSAADADGDTLVFSIANKPAWASFNTSTGALTGTPAGGDVGTTSGVVISVSDGTDTASVTFDLTVLGNGTVSWVAPTTRANGDPLQLSELAGYRIYYGTASDSLDQIVEITDPSTTEEVIQGLEPGKTYYFAVTAYDTEGIESALSQVVSKAVG